MGSVGHRGGAVLVDQRARRETVQAERRVQRVRRVVGDRVRDRPSPTPGVALKPPVPQPQLMYRPSIGVEPDDRRGVGRHVDHARPGAQHVHAD